MDWIGPNIEDVLLYLNLLLLCLVCCGEVWKRWGGSNYFRLLLHCTTVSLSNRQISTTELPRRVGKLAHGEGDLASERTFNLQRFGEVVDHYYNVRFYLVLIGKGPKMSIPY